MNKIYLLLLLITCAFALNAQQANTWTWVKGDKTANASGIYNRPGTPNDANKPGGRDGSITWKDRQGNFWLFGGQSTNSAFYNDLWQYNPAKNVWTWIAGDTVPNQRGTYGQFGVASTSNRPGAREGAVSWTAADGTFWMFGGNGYGQEIAGYLDDLWQYTIGRGWIWMGGDKNTNISGIYGRTGIEDAKSKPGARINAAGWTDTNGYLWLFGGTGYLNETAGYLNDLWRYNTKTNQWATLSGNTGLNRTGVYGSKGVAAATNLPGSRDGAATWIDKSGNLWLFGGTGYSEKAQGIMNDGWKYDISKSQWTWINGDKTTNVTGVYGSLGVLSASSKPGGKTLAMHWTDNDGNFWLFGGGGYDVTGAPGYSNDCWKFTVQAQAWTWMSGDQRLNINGIYGIQGVEDIKNKPGGRYSSTGWIGDDGNLWLFGGYGYPEVRVGFLNDLWRSRPRATLTCPGSRIVEDADTSCAARVYDIDPVFSDQSLRATYTFTGAATGSGVGTASGVNFNLGTTNVLYRLTSDTSQHCSFTIEVDDHRAPVPVVSSLPDVVGSCAVTVTDRPKAKDNCAGIITGTTGDSLVYTRQGTYSITWTYDDGHKNIVTQKQKIIVQTGSDAFAPLIPNLPALTGECAVTVTDIPKASKTCTGIFTATTADAVSYTKQGNYVITWVYNDGNGNVIRQQQKVVVNDVTAPVPVMDTLPVLYGDCSVTVKDTPKAVDNCAGTINGTTTDSLSYTRQGEYVITWTYNDGHNNITTQKQKLVVNAGAGTLIPLVASLPDIIGECSVTVSDIPVASKNCGGIFMATTTDSLTYTQVGEHIITWTFNDNNGAVIKQQQKLVVKPGSGPLQPLLASLPDITGNCSVLVNSRPQATGSCGNIITASTTDPLVYSRQGSYTITWNYDDGNGNTIRQPQRVIIKDALPPVALLPTLPDIIGECSITVTDKPAAIDNCAGKVIATTKDPLLYTKQGTYTINWEYNDGNGNTAKQQQKVILKNPVTLLPRFLTLPDITSDCALTITAKPAIQDYCLGTVEGTTADSLVFTKPGTYTVNWRFITSSDDTILQKQSVIIKKLSLTVSAYPNPASNYFNIIIKSCNKNEKIGLRIYDVLGRVIENRTVQPYEQVILGQHYAVAAYFIQVVQGNERITQKLIKLK